MGFYYPVDNGEPQTCARLFGGEVGIKDTGKVLFVYPLSRILYRDPEHAGGLFPGGFDGQCASVRHSLNGIEIEIEKRLVYLVAVNIDKEEEFMSELERLSAAFGIGVIRLDIDDPDSSEVLLPARAKDSIDWETVNKLAGMNPDFSEFLRRIKNDMRSREIRKEMYDVVMGKDELVGSFAKKKN